MLVGPQGPSRQNPNLQMYLKKSKNIRPFIESFPPYDVSALDNSAYSGQNSHIHDYDHDTYTAVDLIRSDNLSNNNHGNISNNNNNNNGNNINNNINNIITNNSNSSNSINFGQIENTNNTQYGTNMFQNFNNFYNEVNSSSFDTNKIDKIDNNSSKFSPIKSINNNDKSNNLPHERGSESDVVTTKSKSDFKVNKITKVSIVCAMYCCIVYIVLFFVNLC
jgi:hypothetical protein